jgi:EAL domain-containing protein (putative c-di-GMP-specific phosphodiesterase class I)
MSENQLPTLETQVTVPPHEDEGQSTNLDHGPAAILVIDDDEALGQAYRRQLMGAGLGTLAVTQAEVALELLRKGELFDAIVSDIVMPNMDGIALMSEVRKYNLDVPIILSTGNPNLESAISAIQFGAFRYLTKPVESDVLVATVREAVSQHRLARLKREALVLLAPNRQQLGDRVSLEVHFERALKRLWIAYQPIIDLQARVLVGYEALVRSGESTLGSPALLFDAAERLGCIDELGRCIRRLVAGQIPQAPRACTFFVNIHATDLQDEHLTSPQAPLSEFASRVVLEVTDRFSLDHIPNVETSVSQLRGLGYRVALDDLGAGYAGLGSFSRLQPDFVKLDSSLIREIDMYKRQQSLVRSLLSVCNRELAIDVICEGVETEAERDTLEVLGAGLMQGYLFGRPVAEFARVAFEGRANDSK